MIDKSEIRILKFETKSNVQNTNVQNPFLNSLEFKMTSSKKIFI